jgi:sodium-dependent dicarboxylate transporter 2/3/5
LILQKTMKKKTLLSAWLKPGISVLIPLLIVLMPASWLHIPGITPVEQRVLALFLLAALFWILEPIPIFATSVLIIVLELIMISDAGLGLLRYDSAGAKLSNLLDYRDIMATFASPVILLFLGGFFLAMSAVKFRLDQSLAAVLLRPFGQKPTRLLLGIMAITAVFSMFMSNTATTAMMLAVLAPVLPLFEPGDRGRVAFTLGVPFAANIGGVGTPIGTPPNAIALKYLTGDDAIGFGQWMSFGVPLVLVLLLGIWLLLITLYPARTPALELKFKTRFLRTPKAYIVYATFILTLLLWLTDFWHGMNSYVVSMIPVAVFLSFGIIGKEDLKNISWDVLWLVAGGIALGLALEKSGLATRLVTLIPFAGLSALTVLAISAFVGLLMANFMSNTGTANLLLPIVAALGTSGLALESTGGIAGVILGVTLSISLGMSLPISTPPNALAHATGEIRTPDMARAGVLIGLIGLGFVIALILLLTNLGFFK